MARFEIIDKLDVFLKQHNPLTEECHTVYLMVEIRKILDHENCRDFPLLRFYCNWTVHTEKDTTGEMRSIMDRIYQELKKKIENRAIEQTGSPALQFFYMNNLKEQMKDFLEKREITTSLINIDNWVQFVQLLIKVLENQPIKNPTPDITLFSFIPVREQRAAFDIKFKRPINGLDHYKLELAY